MPTPTSIGDAAAEVIDFATAYDLNEMPVTADECVAWFEVWSHDYLRIELVAAQSGDPSLASAVADHRSTASAALADCIEGRPIDRSELAAAQEGLEEVLP